MQVFLSASLAGRASQAPQLRKTQPSFSNMHWFGGVALSFPRFEGSGVGLTLPRSMSSRRLSPGSPSALLREMH